jgi:hypothetical protein
MTAGSVPRATSGPAAAGSRRARLLAWAAAGAGALAGAVVLAHWTPLEGTTICFLRRAFDLPCPGCGMTRAFGALARGDWGGAVAFHPWAPVLAAELASAWVLWGAALVRPLPAGWRRAVAPVLAGNFAALVALWLGRLATGTLPM